MKRFGRVLPAVSARPEHVEALRALAHLSRLRAFFFLVRQAHETPAGDIQEATGIPAPTLSHHLDVLRRAGLVQSRRQERFVLYSVRREAVTELARLLTACC